MKIKIFDTDAAQASIESMSIDEVDAMSMRGKELECDPFENGDSNAKVFKPVSNVTYYWIPVSCFEIISQ